MLQWNLLMVLISKKVLVSVVLSPTSRIVWYALRNRINYISGVFFTSLAVTLQGAYMFMSLTLNRFPAVLVRVYVICPFLHLAPFSLFCKLFYWPTLWVPAVFEGKKCFFYSIKCCKVYFVVFGRYSLIPVGEGHHDVKRSQDEAEVEERVAVGHAVLFVIHGPSHSILPHFCVLIHRQLLPLLRLHQLIHLRVIGWSDAARNMLKGIFFTHADSIHQLLKKKSPPVLNVSWSIFMALAAC